MCPFGHTLELRRSFFFQSFLFFQPHLSGNERPKNFVYSRNIGIPESSARKLFGYLFPRIFREPDAARLPPPARPNFFMKIQLPSLIGIGKRLRSVELSPRRYRLSRFAIYKSSGKWRHAAHKSSFQPNFQAVANDSFV